MIGRQAGPDRIECSSLVECQKSFFDDIYPSATSAAISGEPEHISTSYVERQTLTLRMASKRFARLSNGFSKKLDYHLAAVALHVAFYNLCRVHESLRSTPAMTLGIADRVWTISDLIRSRA